MAGHAQFKFVMTECSKTQIRLTRPIYQMTLILNDDLMDALYGRKMAARINFTFEIRFIQTIFVLLFFLLFCQKQ